MHSPAKDAYVIPTGTIFMTIERVYIHPTIVIAVNKLSINECMSQISFEHRKNTSHLPSAK